jgi:hypothetical protein
MDNMAYVFQYTQVSHVMPNAKITNFFTALLLVAPTYRRHIHFLLLRYNQHPQSPLSRLFRAKFTIVDG